MPIHTIHIRITFQGVALVGHLPAFTFTFYFHFSLFTFKGVALTGHLLASKIWVFAGCRVPGLTNKYQFFVLFCWKTSAIVSMLPKSPKIGFSSADLPGDLNVDSQRNRVECEAKVGKLLLKVFIYNRTLESSKHCCCKLKFQLSRCLFQGGFHVWLQPKPVNPDVMCGYTCCSSNKPFIFVKDQQINKVAKVDILVVLIKLLFLSKAIR